MTVTEQQAIYDKIHEVQVELIRDNQLSHDKIRADIVKLTLKVKETNGLKEKIEKLADAQLTHLAEHRTLYNAKNNGFNRTTTIVAVIVAICSLGVSLITSLM